MPPNPRLNSALQRCPRQMSRRQRRDPMQPVPDELAAASLCRHDLFKAASRNTFQPQISDGFDDSRRQRQQTCRSVTSFDRARRSAGSHGTQPVAAAIRACLPGTAKGQQGSVILQVLIARDGSVEDAKFMQGSLAFARAATDAVKQWRFKPYKLNGRPVSTRTVLTLTFKPGA